MASREILWNISLYGEVLMYLLGAAAVVALIYGVRRQASAIMAGRKTDFSWSLVRASLGKIIIDILSNRRLFRNRHFLGGTVHFLIFWGMAGLFVGTAIIAVEYDLFRKLLGMNPGFLSGGFFLAFEFCLDLLGLFLLLGLVLALVRRYVLKRPQLMAEPRDLILPVWLIVIALTGFMVEGLRLAAGDPGYSPAASPVGLLFSLPWSGSAPETILGLHAALWWVHLFLALGWIACLPFTPKAFHILAGAANLALENLRAKGRLALLDVEEAFENDDILGYESIKDLTRKDLLDLSSCTECGRCEKNCPANISGKSLSPRRVVLSLQEEMKAALPPKEGAHEAPSVLTETRISPEDIEACTTCMACVEACPVSIDPLAKILEMRRYQVMIKDEYPDIFAEVFTGTEKRGNPWNEHPTARMDWAKGLDVPVMADIQESGKKVEYLFWVGCSAAFDPRNQKIARSMVRLLEAAGIEYAVLGEEERCTGDAVRRIGHEYLFQVQAETVIETINQYEFSKILTICPHCFNTLKNEYPDLGGKWEVVHHSVLIAELLKSGKIRPERPIKATVAFHDSCYLGRHNRIFDQPRQVLKAVPGLKVLEMDQSREFGMCCGAGGGLTWIEEEQGRRVNDRRIEQARATLEGGDGEGDLILCTACPFCMTMLEDGLAAVETRAQDRDIAELVAESIGLET